MSSASEIFLADFHTAEHALAHLTGSQECTVVTPDQMPPTARKLLVHNSHMTTTLQTHFGGPVQLHVHNAHLNGSSYLRHITLTLPDKPQVLEYGVVRIHMSQIPEEVRTEILAHKTPLGRILINHNVMRRVEPLFYIRLPAAGQVMQQFATAPNPAPAPAHDIYGRLAVLHCNHQPAIELLELVTEL